MATVRVFKIRDDFILLPIAFCCIVSQTETKTAFGSKLVKLVRSVDRAIKILVLVAQADEPIGLSEISRVTQIDKATALRLLSTLEASSLVKRDFTTRRYGPGHNIWRLASYWRNDLRTASRPHLEALRRATEETISLVCPRGLERVVIDALAAPHELCVVPVLGSALPVYTGASGKVIMAYMPDEERNRVIELTNLKPVNPATPTDRRSYLAVIEDVRRKGYAVSSGDVTVGASAIAAPIFDAAGKIAAIVSVRGPDVRMSAERMKQIAPLVVEKAQDISQELGFEMETSRVA